MKIDKNKVLNAVMNFGKKVLFPFALIVLACVIVNFANHNAIDWYATLGLAITGTIGYAFGWNNGAKSNNDSGTF